MVDIPTGYFFLVVSGSGIMGLFTGILLFKLFQAAPTQQSGRWSKVKEGDSTQALLAFREEISRHADEKMHYFPQAYLRVRSGDVNTARELVHRLRGYIKTERITGNREYAILDVTIPTTQWGGFERRVRESGLVLDAYSHYGSRIYRKIK